MNAALAIQLLLGLLDRASAIGDLLKKAKDEGRDLTEAEIDKLVEEDDAAKEALEEAIAKARGE